MAEFDIRIECASPRPHVVEALLRELPEWFGIEEAITEYVSRSSQLPTYVAIADEEPVAVLVMEHHTSRVAEMYVLAVSRRLHRRGVGRALVAAAEADLIQQGATYLQVKTLWERAIPRPSTQPHVPFTKPSATKVSKCSRRAPSGPATHV